MVFEDLHWDIRGASAEGLFKPENFGLECGGGGTACYRGYISTYHVQDSLLQLLSLLIRIDVATAPPLNGHLPTTVEDSDLSIFGRSQYSNVNLTIPLTGGLLLAREKTTLPVSIGPELVWRFSQIRELIFDEGKLIRQHDRSTSIAALRARWALKRNEVAEFTDKDSIVACYDAIESEINDCFEFQHSESYSLAW